MLNKPFPWQKANNILVTTHAFVDPDALGSILTMGGYLKSLGKQAALLARGGVPRNLRFLCEEEEVLSELPQPLHTFDLAVVLDCGAPELPNIPGLAGPNPKIEIVNIDHHFDNTGFGRHNWVAPDFSSVAEMLFELLENEGYRISALKATALLAGIMGDTGAFRHASTRPQTLITAAKLLQLAANLSGVVRHLFAGKTMGQLKAWSYILEKANLDENTGALISALTAEDMAELDVDDNAYEGIVDIMNTFPGAKYAAFVRQRGGQVKFSLRSEEYKGMNVSELAQKFGGGGHKLAAGFTLPGRLRRQNGDIYIEPMP